jgi:hypothetical protein
MRWWWIARGNMHMPKLRPKGVRKQGLIPEKLDTALKTRQWC